MQGEHQRGERKDIFRQEAGHAVVCQQAEQRRHCQRADIRAGKLRADERLRLFRAEKRRCHVNDTGIYRRAAEPHHEKADERCRVLGTYDQRECASRDNGAARAHHLPVAQLIADKAGERTSGGHADVKEADKRRRVRFGKAAAVHEEAAAPEARRPRSAR